jgi:hypothetical protein
VLAAASLRSSGKYLAGALADAPDAFGVSPVAAALTQEASFPQVHDPAQPSASPPLPAQQVARQVTSIPSGLIRAWLA